jgi:hypothetical protein
MQQAPDDLSTVTAVCTKEAGLVILGKSVTLGMKTQRSALQMLLRLEEPLGGFDFKWQLLPWEKSATNLCKFIGTRKERNCFGREALSRKLMQSKSRERRLAGVRGTIDR